MTVAELNPVVLRWCRGPLVVLTDDALGDPRTRAVVGDVMDEVREAGGRGATRLDAIVLDLYVGPDDGRKGESDSLYGEASVADIHAALNDGGSYAVWGEEPSLSFERRLVRGGFQVRTVRTRGPGPHHVVFLAIKNRRGR